MGYFSDIILEEDQFLEEPSRVATDHMTVSEQFHETNAGLATRIKQQSHASIGVAYQGMILNDIVKNLLEKHFGTPRKTLTIDGKSQRSNCIYFYTLQDKGKVLSIRNALNANLSGKKRAKLVDLTQIYNPTGRKQNLRANQCACYTEYAGEWTVGFYIIEGIRYHKSFGKQIAASLSKQYAPFFLRGISSCAILFVQSPSKKKAASFPHVKKLAAFRIFISNLVLRTQGFHSNLRCTGLLGNYRQSCPLRCKQYRFRPSARCRRDPCGPECPLLSQSKKIIIPGTGSAEPSIHCPRSLNHWTPLTQPANLGITPVSM